MGMFDKPKIGQELLDVPMGDMIQQMAFAIAEAQRKLDENSIDTAQMMGGLQTVTDDITGEVTFQDSRVFFGKEKVTMADAITLHNQSTDISIRQSVRESLTAAGITLSYPNLDVSFTTVPLLEAGGAASADPAKVYKVGTDYYKIATAGTPNSYVTVTEYHSNIATVDNLVGGTIYVPSRVSMLELGFSPTFYQFVDTIIEVKISIKYTQDGAQTRNSASSNSNSRGFSPGFLGLVFGGPKKKVVTTSHVNAGYSQKFSYSAEGSSLLRTKLVPIPPPAILEERIRLQMEVLRDEPLPPATT